MNSKANEGTDEDCLFLEQVLDKLYDFGNGPGSKKKSQKKKKRKSCEEEEEQEEEEEVSVMKSSCSDAADVRVKDAVVTKAEQTGKKSKSQVEVVTFQDPRKKQKTNPTPVADKEPAPQAAEKTPSDQSEELSLEKARLEVHWFGITGYKKEQQRVLEQNRAVMLGARPPKKEYVNYKVLQQQIKEKKQKAKEEAQPNKKKQNTQRDKKTKMSSSSTSAPLGQVGRFKNGVLVLSSKEIQKIKGTKQRK
ncbi:uncharacterized protein V6R79_023044 [Siganus canaliculatus]